MWSPEKTCNGQDIMRKTIISLGGAALLAAVAGASTARPALKDVERITEGLIATGIAYEISNVCDSIDARTLRGINFLWSLKGHARELGYTEAEIDAFVDDKAEQARLEGIARQRLASMGAVAGRPDTYCDVGRAEIAAQTEIGQLLR